MSNDDDILAILARDRELLARAREMESELAALKSANERLHAQLKALYNRRPERVLAVARRLLRTGRQALKNLRK